MFSANLVILAQICDELLRGLVKFPRILSQNAKMTLKVKVNDPHFQYQLSVPWCMFGANLVIPAQICDELSCGQGNVYGRMDRQTGRHKQRQYPFGLKVQRVKTFMSSR